METYLGYAPAGFESFQEAMPLWAAAQAASAGQGSARNLGPNSAVNFASRIITSRMRPAHSSLRLSRRQQFLTLDAVGEWSTSSIGLGRGNTISLTHEMRFPHSLGMLYSAFTYYTGFKVNSGEYKLMGLAPYGKPKYVDQILGKIATINGGRLTLAGHVVFQLLPGPDDDVRKVSRPVRRSSAKVGKPHHGKGHGPGGFNPGSLRGGGAEGWPVMRTGRPAARNLVMAGGVALNCVANGRLLREGPFENIWIQPAAGDAGGALGAALLVWHHVLENPRRIQTPDAQKGSLLGPAFQNDDIRLFLDSVGAAVRIRR